MRVLVTGATGFLGRHITTAFLEAGHSVVGVGQQPKHKASISAGVDYYQHNLLVSDSTSQKANVEIFDGLKIDTLVHLAWNVRPRYWTSLENLDWLVAGITLYKSAIASGVRRIVGAGTCAEYEWSCDFLSPAVTPLTPSSLYGKAKNSLREVLESASQISETSFAWGRIFFPYGPFESPERLVPSVINSLLCNKPALCSHGRQERDFMFASDVARAFVVVAESDFQGALNIASGQCTSVREVVNTLVDLVGGTAEFGAVTTHRNEPPRLAADVSQLLALGFKPKTTLQKGLQDSVDWWKPGDLSST